MTSLPASVLEGLRILVLEDEFLIAMDVEQLCRDHGAAEVTIVRNLLEIEHDPTNRDFDAAIVDLLLDGTSTLDFAQQLKANDIPFVFASGFTDRAELLTSFPGAILVGKPYSGDDLIAALATACGRATMV